MKTYVLALLCFCVSRSLYGAIEKLDPERIEKIRNHLIRIPKPTADSKPDITALKKQGNVVAAEIVACGRSSLFTVENEQDFQKLNQTHKDKRLYVSAWYKYHVTNDKRR